MSDFLSDDTGSSPVWTTSSFKIIAIGALHGKGVYGQPGIRVSHPRCQALGRASLIVIGYHCTSQLVERNRGTRFGTRGRSPPVMQKFFQNNC